MTWKTIDQIIAESKNLDGDYLTDFKWGQIHTIQRDDKWVTTAWHRSVQIDRYYINETEKDAVRDHLRALDIIWDMELAIVPTYRSVDDEWQ